MKKNKIFLFFGPPGSGKGTLSEMCVDQFGWLQLSTGNLCRQHIANGTVVGKKIQQIIASGQLVSDEIIVNMVVDWIKSQSTKPEGIVFDGYPRTLAQAQMLYDFWQKQLFEFDLVLVKLNIDRQLLFDRVTHRIVCSNKNCGRVCDVCGSALEHRPDDTQDSLKLRLKIYYQHEQEILDFYVGKGLKIHELNADQGARNLFDDFKKTVL